MGQYKKLTNPHYIFVEINIHRSEAYGVVRINSFYFNLLIPIYDLHLIKEILMLYKHLVKTFVYTTSYGLLWVIALQLKTIITLLEGVIK